MCLVLATVARHLTFVLEESMDKTPAHPWPRKALNSPKASRKSPGNGRTNHAPIARLLAPLFKPTTGQPARVPLTANPPSLFQRGLGPMPPMPPSRDGVPCLARSSSLDRRSSRLNCAEASTVPTLGRIHQEGTQVGTHFSE